jgi:hypothetical protein
MKLLLATVCLIAYAGTSSFPFLVRVVPEQDWSIPSEKMRKWVFKSPLHEAPNRSSKKVGEILLKYDNETIEPEHFFIPEGGSPVKFSTDPFEGYEERPYMTAIERRGNWIKLPKRPFPKEVWVEFTANGILGQLGPEGEKTEWGIVNLAKPFTATVLKSRKVVTITGNIKILLEKDGKFLFRKEMPHDMACGQEIPIPKNAMTPVYEVSVESFLDSDGHIILNNSYSRGC